VLSCDDNMATPGRHTYVRMTLVSLWENLPLVLLSGAVFTLLCVPASLLFLLGPFAPALIVGALTVAPACAALLAQENEIVHDVKANIGTMFKALPRFWARGVGLGLLGCFPLSVALLTLPMLSLPRIPLVVWLGLGADVLGLLILAALYLYAFPLLVLHDVSVGTALRNALILASRHIWNTLGLLGMGILFALASVYVSPVLLFVLPAIWGLFIVNNCRMVVEEELAYG
jgi:uncharacterized membrane protein YesL